MQVHVTHHRHEIPRPTGQGDFGRMRAAEKTGPLGFKFEGSHAGDRLELQFKNPQSGQWQTIVADNQKRHRAETDLGYLNAGQELEFKLVNHSQRQEYHSASGQARMHKNADGSVTVAFEDRTRGDWDFNDFVFTVYQKAPAQNVTVHNAVAQAIVTDNNKDTVTLTGEIEQNTVKTGWDNDEIRLVAQRSFANRIFAEAGDDQIEGEGSFEADVIDGGEGDDEILLQGTLKNVTIQGGVSSTRTLEGLEGIAVHNDGGNDRITLAGQMESVTLSAGGGQDEITLVGDAGASTLDAGDGEDVVQVLGTLQDTQLQLGEGDDQLVLNARTRNVTVELGRGNDSVILDEGWSGDLTLHDGRRARQDKNTVTDYDHLILAGPGWSKVDDRTYQKTRDGVAVGTVHLAGDPKDLEVIRDDQGQQFQNVAPKKKKRGLFGKIFGFVAGALSFIAPPIGAALNVAKTAFDVVTGKVQGLGNILKSVAGSVASLVPGNVGNLLDKAVSIGSKVVDFVKSPSLEGVLGIASGALGGSAVGKVVDAVDKGVKLVTGKIKDLGSAIAAVGGTIADFVKGGVRKTVETVTRAASKVVAFIDKPSVSAALDAVSAGAAATGNPVTSSVASGLAGLAQGVETDNWEAAGSRVGEAVRDIRQVDAARTLQAQAAEARKQMEARLDPLDAYLQTVSLSPKLRLLAEQRGELLPQREIKSATDPDLRPGDLVKSPITGKIGEVQASGLIAYRELDGGTSYETSLLAGTFGLSTDPPTELTDTPANLFDDIGTIDPIRSLADSVRELTDLSELIEVRRRAAQIVSESRAYLDNQFDPALQDTLMERIQGAFDRKYRDIRPILAAADRESVLAHPLGREYLSELAIVGEMQRRWLVAGKANVEYRLAFDQVRLLQSKGAPISTQLSAMQTLERTARTLADAHRDVYSLGKTFADATNLQESTGKNRFTELLLNGAVRIDGEQMREPSQLWDFAVKGDALMTRSRRDPFWGSEPHQRMLAQEKDPSLFIDPSIGKPSDEGINPEILWDLTQLIAGFTPADFIFDGVDVAYRLTKLLQDPSQKNAVDLGISALAFLIPGASAALFRRVFKGTENVGDLKRVIEAASEMSPAQRQALGGSEEAVEQFLRTGKAADLPARAQQAGRAANAVTEPLEVISRQNAVANDAVDFLIERFPTRQDAEMALMYELNIDHADIPGLENAANLRDYVVRMVVHLRSKPASNGAGSALEELLQGSKANWGVDVQRRADELISALSNAPSAVGKTPGLKIGLEAHGIQTRLTANERQMVDFLSERFTSPTAREMQLVFATGLEEKNIPFLSLAATREEYFEVLVPYLRNQPSAGGSGTLLDDFVEGASENWGVDLQARGSALRRSVAVDPPSPTATTRSGYRSLLTENGIVTRLTPSEKKLATFLEDRFPSPAQREMSLVFATGIDERDIPFLSMTTTAEEYFEVLVPYLRNRPASSGAGTGLDEYLAGVKDNWGVDLHHQVETLARAVSADPVSAPARTATGQGSLLAARGLSPDLSTSGRQLSDYLSQRFVSRAELTQRLYLATGVDAASIRGFDLATTRREEMALIVDYLKDLPSSRGSGNALQDFIGKSSRDWGVDTRDEALRLLGNFR